MPISHAAGERIFHHAGQYRISHDEAPLAPALKLVGQQPESISVAFKMSDVVPKAWIHLILERAAISFQEESLDGFFPRMAKRRIAHVVRQTSG